MSSIHIAILQLVHEVVKSGDFGLETLALADSLDDDVGLRASDEGIGGEFLPVIDIDLPEAGITK